MCSIVRVLRAANLRPVLGLHGRRGARRLVRALLADPLAPEAEWERQLSGPDDTDGRGLLIR